MQRAGEFRAENRLMRLYEYLHPDYKMYVYLNDLTSLDDLRATEYEAIQEQQRTLRPSQEGRQEATSSRHPTVVAITYNRDECCWRCKQHGHIHSHCQRPTKRFRSQRGKDGVFTRECYSPAGNSRRTKAAPAAPRSWGNLPSSIRRSRTLTCDCTGETEVLLDIGSEVSCTSHAVLRRVRSSDIPPLRVTTEVRLANGTVGTTRGHLLLPLKIEQWRYHHRFYVLYNLSAATIIGVDLWQRLRISLTLPLPGRETSS